jgi:hypothetical protein
MSYCTPLFLPLLLTLLVFLFIHCFYPSIYLCILHAHVKPVLYVLPCALPALCTSPHITRRPARRISWQINLLTTTILKYRQHGV